MYDTIPAPRSTPSPLGSVLLVEDDESLARSLARVIGREGYEVTTVGTGGGAVTALTQGSFDVVLSDLHLPGTSGVDVLNLVRAYDPDVSLVLMTGAPSVSTAVEAVNLGVLEYMIKPTSSAQLSAVLARATATRRRASAASTLRPRWDPPSPAPLSPSVGKAVDRTFASLAVQFDPVLDAAGRWLVGVEAKIASKEEALASTEALVLAAERAGRLNELRRRSRDLAVKAFVGAPRDALLFVDVDGADLSDPDLFNPEAPLSVVADRVVLQVRGRGAMRSEGGLAARVTMLRMMGFKFAATDLDATQGLSRLSELMPEYVKLDERLVRAVDEDGEKARFVASLIAFCRALGAKTVAEGVTTAAQREMLSSLGCDLVQGPPEVETSESTEATEASVA